MESDEIEGKLKSWLSKSAKASKKAMEKVGDKVQDFTDKSVVKMEKKQLQNKLESKYVELGKKVSCILESGCNSDDENKCLLNLTEDDEKKIKDIQSEIENLIEEIEIKDKEIKD